LVTISSARRPRRFLLPVALASVWIFWGSTFAGMHLAVQSIPAFAMSSLRFTIAGAVLWAFAALRGKGRATVADFRRSVVCGIALLVLGNAVTAWSLVALPTGLASLIVSLSPVWMAAFDFALYRQRVGPAALAGMALGVVGLALLVNPRVGGPLPLVPLLALIFGSVAWAYGSIYQRRSGRVDNVLTATAMQMLVGGIVLALQAGIMGQWAHLSAITPASFFGLGWLIVFGSLVGYSAYLWLFQNASTALSATYAYVNPLIAVAIGVALFHEAISPLSFAAGLVIVVGVALMMLPQRPVPASEPEVVAA
jgi:drug/metabolite transporter (DMT)-like permease